MPAAQVSLRGLMLRKELRHWLPWSLEVKTGLQFDVVLFSNADWKPALERGDSRHGPAVQDFALEAFILWNREFPIVRTNRFLRVEERERTVSLRIDRVYQVLK